MQPGSGRQTCARRESTPARRFAGPPLAVIRAVCLGNEVVVAS